MSKDDLESMMLAIKRIERMVGLFMGGKTHRDSTAIDIKLIKKQIETEMGQIQ